MGEEIEKQAMAEYERWLKNTENDEHFHNNLLQIQGNKDEITDAFYRHIAFGTSGMRGLLGPGTNRINKYVVRRATQGIANYLKRENRPYSVVIGYDSRRGSKYFASEVAAIMRGNLIKPYLFQELCPVSVLSYAVRRLGCDLGIMITASHNPKIYNGYKVYNREGFQIIGEQSEEIFKEIEKLDYFDESIKYTWDSGIVPVDESISLEFINHVAGDYLLPDQSMMNGFKAVYTPLHGTGRKYVTGVFNKCGVNYDVVKSQEMPDKEFTTCVVPNPEKVMAYDEGFKWIDKYGGDVIIATDPDCDRIGAATYHLGMRTVLTGNQLGILMLDYLCHLKPPKENQMVIRSIATSPLTDIMAQKYGFRVVTTLTGFKYIGDVISKLDAAGRGDEFYFAFEESDSYLMDPFIREKDGVSGALLAVEMAAFHKSQGKDLVTRLEEIYEEFGYYADKTRNYYFSGPRGREIMASIMNEFRTYPSESIGDRRIVKKIDYQQHTSLPKADVVEFDLDDGSKFLVRPSGTEAIIKVYSFETGSFTAVENDIVRIIDKFK
ncbi:MAG: phospho-sugar mutase [Anaerovoracaceae bacterium]|jgi:phosphoglucomutase